MEYNITSDQLKNILLFAEQKGYFMAFFNKYKCGSKNWINNDEFHSVVSIKLNELIGEIYKQRIKL